MTTGNEWALSRGNDFPIRVTITSEHGETVTGLSPIAYFATTKGGEAITDPITSGALTEDTSTPSTARVYHGTRNASIVDELVDAAIEAGRYHYWLAISIADDLLVWRRIDVIEHRVLS